MDNILQNKKNKNIIVVYLYVLISAFLFAKPILKVFGLYFNWIDELIVLLLGVCLLLYKSSLKFRELLITSSVLFFFLLYSLVIHTNVVNAVILDFFIFFKPFVAFYAAYFIPIKISQKTCLTLYVFFAILGFGCWILFLGHNFFDVDTKELYPISLYVSSAFIFFSKGDKKTFRLSLFFLLPPLIFMLLLGGGNIRSKFICEFVLFIYIFFFLKKKITFKLSWIVLLSLLTSLMIYLTWGKFNRYFIEGDDDIPRIALYQNSVNVFRDYFPLGPGYGTYATEAAARYYSPLYYRYGMHKIWGLSPQSYGNTGHNFLNDTFYPILVQFGIFGPLLWIVFWRTRWKEALFIPLTNYKLFLFSFLVIMIQCVAANSFTGEMGIPCMMMIGFALNSHLQKGF